MSGSKKFICLLAILQALLLTNNVTTFLLGSLIGFALAPDGALATVPLLTFVIGAAMTALPISLLMKRMGRRFGFMLGVAIGFAGAGLCALAVLWESFFLFSLGTFLAGSYGASGQYYRFAAAEAVGASYSGRAISYVLAGGIVGAFLGPETATYTRDAFATTYLGPYLALMGFAVFAFALLLFFRFPEPVAAGDAEVAPARPLREVLAQPRIKVAILGAIIGYAVMNFLMTATSLAMSMHQHSGDDTAFVIEWHIVAMFAPSFFTGALIQRFGVMAIMSWGACFMIAAAIAAAAGTSVAQFWTALFLLGVGWNFLYIGGTTLLTTCHRPSERGKVQGLNDMLVFIGTGTSSLLSGALLYFVGWQTMVLATLPLPVIALAVLAWASRRSSTAPPATV